MIKHAAPRNYMTLNFEFSGIRVQNSYFTPVDWELSVNLLVSRKKGKSKEDIEYSASIAYQRLYFWLDANLQCMIAVDVGSEDDLYIANLSSNITMFCPGNPGDDMLIRLIHSKLTALAGPDMIISEIKMKASDTSLQYTYDSLDGEYDLPVSTDYTGNDCRDEIPWWSRNDGFCFEFVKSAELLEDGEIVDDMFETIIDPMSEFERIIAEMSDTHIGVVREPARIVQVEKWKPRKVE